jgi:hypothetical protein
MNATEADPARESELCRVVRWRESELLRAGYGTEAALRLAEHVEIDLHRAASLLKGGCSEDVALRILL